MTKTSDKDLIINRIKKLFTHADSAKELGSIAEAEVFIKKANQLLLEHNLELHQIPFGVDEDRFAKWVYGEDISYKDNQAGDRWQLNLITVLTKYNLCSYTYKARRKTFKVYGKLENVDSVVWLFNYLTIGFIRIAREAAFKRTREEKQLIPRNPFLKSFLLGTAAGLKEKYKEQFRELQNQDQLRGLILYNDKALEEFVNIQVPNIKPGRRLPDFQVNEAYEKGIEIGKNYSINKPLTVSKEFESKLLN